jgi:peptidoglycan/LPS O-acetylase OafA/YrhL
MKTRNAALDLSRFLAAFIVLTGHFLYFDSNLTEVAKINFLEIFHTGAKSVEYFFALSGYVLTRSLSSINISWLKARFVRLMPIYIYSAM